MIDRRRLREIEEILDNEADDLTERDLVSFEMDVQEYIAQPEDPGKWPEVAEALLQRLQSVLREVRRGKPREPHDRGFMSDRREVEAKAPGAHGVYR